MRNEQQIAFKKLLEDASWKSGVACIKLKTGEIIEGKVEQWMDEYCFTIHQSTSPSFCYDVNEFESVEIL
jgi:hypothetical protein